MSNFNKDKQTRNEDEPFVEPAKEIKGKEQTIATPFKKLDHSEGPDTDKKLNAPNFKDINKD